MCNTSYKLSKTRKEKCIQNYFPKQELVSLKAGKYYNRTDNDKSGFKSIV